MTLPLSGERVVIDRLIRSNRKTIALEINRDGELIVRAPRLATKKQIETLVKEKQGWIMSKQTQALRRRLENPPRKFLPGELFLFLGDYYPLFITSSQEEALILHDAFYLGDHAVHQAKEIFESWYKAHAFEVVRECTERYASLNGFEYSRLSITSAKTRWGSCGPKGSLNFSWRIVMAPLEVIDYIVVHELIHLKDRTHSKGYWHKVKRLLPDYRQRINWLKENGHLLSID